MHVPERRETAVSLCCRLTRQHGCGPTISSPDNSIRLIYQSLSYFFIDVSLEYKLTAFGFENFFLRCGRVAGHEALDLVPEGFLVMAESEMRKFVDNDVLGNDCRGKERECGH